MLKRVLLIITLIIGIQSSLWAVATNGTHNFGAPFAVSGNDLVSSDFILSGVNGGTPIPMAVLGTTAYPNGNSTPPPSDCIITLAADGTNTGSFELTGMSVNEFNALANFTNAHVVGNVLGGGTVQSDTIAGVNGVQDTWTFDFTNFSGVQITSFVLTYTTSSSGGAVCSNLDYNSFTIANASAPLPAPTVTAISPSSGPATGGTSVTITGTNFTGATAVTIGGVAATGVSITNATTITATTPAGTAGAQDVVVTTPGGTGTGTGLFTYTVSSASSSSSSSSSSAAGTLTVTPVTPAVTPPATAPADILTSTAYVIHSTSPGNPGYTETVTFNIAATDPGYYTGFWKYGPTHDNTTPHWYDFGTTAANNASGNVNKTGTGYQISNGGKTVTIFLVDGKDGDDDLTANEVIDDDAVPIVSAAPAAGSVAVPFFGPFGYVLLASLFGFIAMRRFKN